MNICKIMKYGKIYENTMDPHSGRVIIVVVSLRSAAFARRARTAAHRCAPLRTAAHRCAPADVAKLRVAGRPFVQFVVVLPLWKGTVGGRC